MTIRDPEGITLGTAVLLHDVTRFRFLDQFKTDLVATVSHELKTPLATIKVNAETLLDWGLHDDAVNVTLLRQIDEQVDRLDRLVQDMLRLARLESGQEPFRFEPMALGPVVRSCIEHHLERVRALTDCTEPERAELVSDWEGVLTDLETDPTRCRDRLDWVAKWALVREFQAREGVSDDDPWLRSLDLEYHRLDAAAGLYTDNNCLGSRYTPDGRYQGGLNTGQEPQNMARLPVEVRDGQVFVRDELERVR